MISFKDAMDKRFALPPCPSCEGLQLSHAQQQTVAASLMIMRAHRAVLLCELTGTGKTYVACALAKYIQKSEQLPCIVVAPAHLLSQWRAVTRQCHLLCSFYSYQAASIGKIPAQTQETLWLIDEAHYLKNPATQRFRALFSLTLAHRVCLITATPVSMGYGDLYTLMTLCGFPNPNEGRADDVMVRAYALSVMPQSYTAPLTIDAAPEIIHTGLDYAITPDRLKLEQLLAEISSIEWIAVDSSGSCIRTDIVSQILIHRLLSHRYACLQTLNRLARYYQQRGHSNQWLSHSQFHSMLGLDGTQLLLPFDNYRYGTAVDSEQQKCFENAGYHIKRAQELLNEICQTSDIKCQQIQKMLEGIVQNHRVILFTQYADTAHYFARHLHPGTSVALVTAQGAWYNGHRIAPDIVMDMFNPDRDMPKWWQQTGFVESRVMICTDALATGHNFHRADWMVHLDYPWNPTTLHQREGRIIRKGQHSASVHTICPKLTEAPHVLTAYESNLLERLSIRQTLQNSWMYQTTVQSDECILVEDDSMPGLWARFGGMYCPIAPCCLPSFHGSTTEILPALSAFSSAVRKQHHCLWQMVKKNRHHPQIGKIIQTLIAGLIEFSIMPKHYAHLHPNVTFASPDLNDVFIYEKIVSGQLPETQTTQRFGLNSSTSCIRVRSYPHPDRIASQQTHKLSTGLIPISGTDLIQNRVKSENCKSA